MSDSGILQQFNINELAGATGLILGALGGILAIIFKSRCYCRLNLCYLCFCERKPPPDPVIDSDDEDSKKSKTDDKKTVKVDKTVKDEPVRGLVESEPEPEPEILLPPSNP